MPFNKFLFFASWFKNEKMKFLLTINIVYGQFIKMLLLSNLNL